MIAPLMMWITAAALGQAPPEPDWLKAVPADVDVAIRGNALETIRDDLTAMLRTMSPGLGGMAGPELSKPLARFQEEFGEAAAGRPGSP